MGFFFISFILTLLWTGFICTLKCGLPYLTHLRFYLYDKEKRILCFLDKTCRLSISCGTSWNTGDLPRLHCTPCAVVGLVYHRYTTEHLAAIRVHK